MSGSTLLVHYSGRRSHLQQGDRLDRKSVPSGNILRESTIRPYTYYADGKLKTTTANGIIETYTYDDFGRTVSKVYTVSGAEKERHEYVYDKNSNIIEETIVNNWPAGSSSKVNETRTYTYDNLGQLIQSVVTGSKSETITYAYDIVGNRKKETVGTTVTEYHYNSQNMLLEEIVTVAGTEDAVISYAYDANGNLTQKENSKTDITETYGYDASNQMTFYEVDGTVMQSNVYNGDGQRIQKTAGSGVTNYFYGDSGLLYTTDGNSSLKALQYYDAYGDLFANSTVVGNSVNQYYYTDDIRDSVLNLVDGNNEAVVSYTYTDFGETTEVQSGSIENEIRFTGGVYDEESGLYYLNARFYDPANGRFLNPDSYRGEAAEPQTLHLYAYCANNPITRIDPTGHALETVVDVAFLGMSINDFRKSPTTENFIYVVWDGIATILPFVAGSYMVKGAKVLAKADITAELTRVGLADRISDATKTVTTKVMTAFSKVTQKSSAYKTATNTIKALENANFASRTLLVEHFEKHKLEFKGLFKNADEYLEGARNVMKNGYKVQYQYKGGN